MSVWAQQTSVEGIVVDADTGEKLPFVQIYFIKPSSQGSLASQYGTTSDLDGNFTISNPSGYTTINFQMVGYKTEMYTVKSGVQKKNVKIKMKPDVYGLQDIVVTPKHQKQKYKRKGNPAVELIKDGNHGIPVPDYVDENVSTKVVRIIQSYVGVVNKMVWRKF